MRIFHRVAERSRACALARHLTTTCILAAIAACGGSESGNATGTGDPANPKTGSLAITVHGLPNTSSARVTVSNTIGYARTVTATDTIALLAPGSYDITAAEVSTGEGTFGATPPTQSVTVAAGTKATVTVGYAVLTGALSISASGLPSGATPQVTVTGPNGFNRTVTAGSALAGLAPGAYRITPASLVVGNSTYAPSAPSLEVAVAPSTTPTPVALPYQLASGAIVISVSGLPEGASGTAIVTGPGAFQRSVAPGEMLGNLAPGGYTVTGVPVTAGGDGYRAPAPVAIDVVPSTTPVSVTIPYTLGTGRLAIGVSGLPAGTGAVLTVAGPGNYARSLTSAQTLVGLASGDYTVTAASVTVGGLTYSATPASTNVSVAVGSTASATVTYALTAGPPPPPSNGLNLTIDGMHIQQVVQTYGGSVPLVAGRAGLLRVFVKASAANTAAPGVRVRFYSGATLTNTITIAAPTAATPQAVAEGTLGSSWNYTIPGNVMQPGLRILADVDPTNTVAESSDSDNSYPANGTPATIDVRPVPTFNIRLVPVLQSVNALQGAVTAGNANSYLAQTRAIYPINTIDADVRAPFTTNAPALQSSDGNGAWGQILSEVNALRTADGSTRYYYGVLKVGYSSGIAGLGYVPGRAAIGWDYLPSASGVMAHELGHNFGRFHAPGCGAGGPDSSYPKASGRTEAFGYDIATNALKDTSANYDLMGYCNPDWISAYTYSAVLAYHAANPFSAAAALGGGYARRGLLVWGRVQNGEVILEPTFEVDAPPTLPQRPGRHRVRGLGALGEVLFDLSFDGERVADHPDAIAEHFAFVVPIGMMRGRLPARVRLDVGNRHAEFTSTTSAAATASTPIVQRVNARAVRVRWSDAATRGILVRHPTSGDILAFARGGDAIVYTGASTLDLVTSDGVRSTRQRVSVAPEGPTPQR